MIGSSIARYQGCLMQRSLHICMLSEQEVGRKGGQVVSEDY